MKLKNYLLKISAIALLVFTSSCGEWVSAMIDKSKALKLITIENEAIPPEFGQNNTTLLCLINGRRSHDKAMIKIVSEIYHGKYEFVRRRELISEKYKDVSKYRYYFYVDELVERIRSYHSGESYKKVTTSYFIIDQKKDIAYESPMKSNAFGKMIKAYMTNLEAVRLKYE